MRTMLSLLATKIMELNRDYFLHYREVGKLSTSEAKAAIPPCHKSWQQAVFIFGKDEERRGRQKTRRGTGRGEEGGGKCWEINLLSFSFSRSSSTDSPLSFLPTLKNLDGRFPSIPPSSSISFRCFPTIERKGKSIVKLKAEERGRGEGVTGPEVCGLFLLFFFSCQLEGEIMREISVSRRCCTFSLPFG